ncbi:ras-responsive element-binding protein 1 [Trichonephila clavata]|uniref:Ras-responsive element-binding protein 1 n=1 Tax=Trichonephila clavata TaxID=2740835 RepID=A0A8X6J583_TRICU|nr:ras-responsive element-binding protein 1 [Trichonephila clavata]
MCPKSGSSKISEDATESIETGGDNTVAPSQNSRCTTRSQSRIPGLKRKSAHLGSSKKCKVEKQTKKQRSAENPTAVLENVLVQSTSKEENVEVSDGMPDFKRNKGADEELSNLGQGDKELKINIEEKYFETCPKCNENFYDARTYHNHIKKYNKDGDFICGLCEQKLCSASSRDRHMVVHSKLKSFTCKICKSQFTTNGNMNRHIQNHEKGKQKVVKTKRKLPKNSQKEDQKNISSEKNYKGEICDTYLIQQGKESQDEKQPITKEKFLEAVELTLKNDTANSLKKLNEDVEPREPLIQAVEASALSSVPMEVVPENEFTCQMNQSQEKSHNIALVDIESGQKEKGSKVTDICLKEREVVPENDSVDEPNESLTEGKTITALVPEKAEIELVVTSTFAAENSDDSISNSHYIKQAHNGSDLATIPEIILNVSSVSSNTSATSDGSDLNNSISQQEKNIEKPYSCPNCSYKSGDKSTLKRHMRLHIKEDNPFLCNVCEKTFTNKNNAERHVREIHKLDNREQIINCIVFKSKNSNTSSEEKRVCKHCKEVCENEQALQYHLRSKNCRHKPYKCKLCGIGASTKHNCYRHIRKQHRELFSEGMSEAEKRAIKNAYTLGSEKRVETLEQKAIPITSGLETKHSPNLLPQREIVNVNSFNENDREVAAEGLLSLSREPEKLSFSTDEPLDLSFKPLDLSGHYRTPMNLSVSEERSLNSVAIHKTEKVCTTASRSYSRHLPPVVAEQNQIKPYKEKTCDSFKPKSDCNSHLKSISQRAKYVQNPPLSTTVKNALQNRILKHSENITPLTNNLNDKQETFQNKHPHKPNVLSLKQESNSDLENEDFASIPSLIDNVNNQKLSLYSQR